MAHEPRPRDAQAGEPGPRDDDMPYRLPGESVSDWLRRIAPDPGPEWSVDDPDPLCRLAARLACCTKPYPPKALLYSDRPWAEIVRESCPDGAVHVEPPAGWMDAWNQQGPAPRQR